MTCTLKTTTCAARFTHWGQGTVGHRQPWQRSGPTAALLEAHFIWQVRSPHTTSWTLSSSFHSLLLHPFTYFLSFSFDFLSIYFLSHLLFSVPHFFSLLGVLFSFPSSSSFSVQPGFCSHCTWHISCSRQKVFKYTDFCFPVINLFPGVNVSLTWSL